MESRQDITAAVKEQTDIVKIVGEHVELKRSGVRYLGLCPFHGEKTPSFSVHGAQQFFYCFGCGESGDVFSFVMKYHNLDFPEALKMLAGRVGIQLPEKSMSAADKRRREKREQMFTLNKKAASVYSAYLHSGEASNGRDYLLSRGIPETAWRNFSIGYAPPPSVGGWDFLAKKLSVKEREVALEVGLLVENDRGGVYDRFRDRVLFPIFDGRGRVAGFGGRIVGEGQPKYMNSPESDVFNKSRLLLGLHHQGEEIRKQRRAVIVEGNFDMISLVVNGCSNVVAPLGTALTSQQIRLLGRYAEEAVLLFDGDEAGKKAVLRSAPLFLAEKMKARVALLPEGDDPDTFIRDRGLEELDKLLDRAAEMSEFVLGQLIHEHGLTLEGKSRIAEEMKPLVASAASDLQRSVFVSHFAEKLGIEAKQLEKMVVGGAPGRRDPGGAERENVMAAAGQPAVSPLDAAQKKVVEFMVLNPLCFDELDKKGVRHVLQGTMGEIIYLQAKLILARSQDVQPEDILTALPDGPEKKLVADILLSASQFLREDQDSEISKQEFLELLNWLEITGMRKLSRQLDQKIAEAQQQGDFERMEKYLLEKQQIEIQVRALNE